MVYMADQPITTSIDDLVKYLKEHGETDSSALASALNVGENIIETWADVLEKAQIVKVSYKLGKMYVSQMLLTKEGVETAKKTVELKKSSAETELATQVNLINQINAKLDEFKRYVAGAEGAFKTKAGQIKDMIDQIDRLNAQVDSAYKRLKDRKEYIDDLSTKLDKDAQRVEEKARATEAVTSKDSDSRRLIGDIRARLDDSENRLKSMSAAFNTTMDQSRASFSELLNSIRDEARLLKDTLNQQEREAHEYASSLNSYRSESESVKRQVARERAKMLDDTARSVDEARKAYAVAEKQSADIKKMLDGMKKQFGGFAELSDKLNGIKSSIDSISRQKDEIQKELEQLSEQLRALSALDDSKMAEKSMAMQRVDQVAAQTSRKINKLGRDAEDIRKGIDEMAE